MSIQVSQSFDFFFFFLRYFIDKCASLMEFLSSPDNEKLIKAVIVAGLYPKVAMIRQSFSKKSPK